MAFPVYARTGDQALVKALNKAIVLDMLRRHSPISRAEIAKVTGLNKATVSALVDELIAGEMVFEAGPGESSGGRRPQILNFNEQAGLVAGAELGVGFLRVAITDLRARVLWRQYVTFAPHEGPEPCVRLLASLIQEGMAAVPPTPRGLLGIGVGVPGLADYGEGRLIYAPNLHWENVPLRDWLQNSFPGLPIIVDNEANAAAVGEHWSGCAKDARTFVYLSVGVGLGAGVMLAGDLFRGVGGGAGEIGHTTIDVNGARCSCGNRGCWELYASEAALQRELNQSIPPGVVVQAARQGDSAAGAALSKVGEALGVGIANTLNTFNPELVVIGGGIAEAGGLVLEPARRVVEQRALSRPLGQTRILTSALGAEACAIGAGALVLHEAFRLPLTF